MFARNSLQVVLNHTASVYSAEFSHNGTYLASASYIREGYHNIITIWDMATISPVTNLTGHKYTILALAFSADDSLLASSDKGSQIIVWDTHTWQEKYRLSMGEPSPYYADEKNFNLAFTPSGDTLIAAGDSGNVMYWNMRTGTLDLSFNAHGRWDIYDLTLSPNGGLLATGTGDRELRIWNVHNSELVRAIGRHKGYIVALDFSPDGKLLASGGASGSIFLFDINNFEKSEELIKFPYTARSVAFSPDGKYLATSAQMIRITDQALIWEVNKRRKRAVIPTQYRSDFWHMAFSPDGRYLVTTAEANVSVPEPTLTLWNMEELLQQSPPTP